MKTFKKNVKKKKKKERKEKKTQHSKTPKPNGKARHEGKKEKRKEKKRRGKTEKVKDPSCYGATHAMTPLPTHDAIAHAHTRKTHLAAQYPHHHQLSHTQTGDPSCHLRRLLNLHCPAQLRCSIAPAFTIHRYLIHHFLQNLI